MSDPSSASEVTESAAISRRLDLILSARTLDALLAFVERLATGEVVAIPIPIAMLVDGHLLRGRIARPLDTALDLDAKLQRILQSASIQINQSDDPNADVVRTTLRETLANPFVTIAESIAERLREADQVVEAIADFSIDKASDELFDKAIPRLAPAGIIDLADAELQLGNGAWLRVGAMRVRREAISGWWVNIGSD